jgi:hypothetical protein
MKPLSKRFEWLRMLGILEILKKFPWSTPKIPFGEIELNFQKVENK